MFKKYLFLTAVLFSHISCSDSRKSRAKLNQDEILGLTENIDELSRLKQKDAYEIDYTGGPGDYRYISELEGDFFSKRNGVLKYIKMIGSENRPVAYFYCEPLNSSYIIVDAERLDTDVNKISDTRQGRIVKISDRVYEYLNR